MNDNSSETPPQAGGSEPSGSAGCYQCGSPEGNQARLCPACTQVRLQKKRAQQEAEQRPRSDYADDAEEDSNLTLYLYAAGVAVVIGFGFWLFFFSVYGPGWGLTRADYAYKKCVHKIGKDFRKEKELQNPGSPAEKYFSSFGAYLTEGISTEICNAVREKCKVEPYGDTCTAVLETL